MTGSRTRARGVVFALCLLAAGCGRAAETPASTATPFLWRVSGPGGGGWLYGTMHVSDPRATRLPASVLAAFEAAGSLHTEIESGLAATGILNEAGNLPPTERLRDHLPPALHQRLVGYLEARRFRADEFERFRPWFATLMLGQLDAIEFLRAGPPLDDLLRQMALARGMRFDPVETIEEQVAALAAGSEADHVHLLDVALARQEEDLAAHRNRLRELLEAWLRGDERAVLRLRDEGLDLTDPVQAAWWDAVLVQRNLRMAERVDRLLRAGGDRPPFIAFGALHFVGAGSVVELLRARGWTVERAR